LVDYLSHITHKRKIGIILGIYNLMKVFDEKYYENLRGGILEAFGILFGHNIKLYVYPTLNPESNEIINLDDLVVPTHLEDLLEFLKKNNKLEKIVDAREDLLHIISDNLLDLIRRGEIGWEEYVPKKVELAIKEKGLFEFNTEKEKV